MSVAAFLLQLLRGYHGHAATLAASSLMFQLKQKQLPAAGVGVCGLRFVFVQHQAFNETPPSKLKLACTCPALCALHTHIHKPQMHRTFSWEPKFEFA